MVIAVGVDIAASTAAVAFFRCAAATAASALIAALVAALVVTVVAGAVAAKGSSNSAASRESQIGVEDACDERYVRFPTRRQHGLEKLGY